MFHICFLFLPEHGVWVLIRTTTMEAVLMSTYSLCFIFVSNFRSKHEFSNEYPQSMEAVQIGTHSLCFPAEIRQIILNPANPTYPYTKVRKKAKIRNQYNHVPHLTQDTIWESDKISSKHHTQESQESSPFPAGYI